MDITTPGQVIAELNRLTAEAAKGPQAIYEAEKAVAVAELAYDRSYSLALLNAEGKTADDRKAIAAIESGEPKFELALAKANLNRVKLKLKQLESAQVAASVIARLVESEMRMTR